jgi:hypothetical protein
LIKYDPNELLKKIAPERKIKKLVSGKLGLKKAALSFITDIDFLSVEGVQKVALKTLKGYRERVKDDRATKSELKSDPAQLVQRVQNEIVTQVASEIKETYDGETYTWLPSDAEEPRPEHQLNYGKTFMIGVGEMPGDEYGCRCGMEIHVKQSRLEL